MPLFQRLQGTELTMDMKSQKSKFVMPARPPRMAEVLEMQEQFSVQAGIQNT